MDVEGELVQSIPKQVNSDKKGISSEKIELAGDSVQVVVAANLGISLLMAKAIQFLWGVVNSLQLIVLTCLFNLSMPDLV